MNQRLLLIAFSIFSFLLVGCSDDEKVNTPLISGLESEYSVLEKQTLELRPAVTSSKEATYSWVLDDKVVANTLEYNFVSENEGEYELKFVAVNKGGSEEKVIKIIVYAGDKAFNTLSNKILKIEIPAFVNNNDEMTLEVIEAASEMYRLTYDEEGHILFASVSSGNFKLKISYGEYTAEYVIAVSSPEDAVSEYTAFVYDFLPAPGQNVNKYPAYIEGDTHETMLAKVMKAIVENNSFVTLGGWGGYVEFGFDHTIVNVPGKRDFRINGNSMVGGAEPGIIMVAYDKNQNGKPDEDEWYEIAGSGNFTAENELWYDKIVLAGGDVNTYRDYEMTYYRPEVEENVASKTYIRWTDNKGNDAYKEKNSFNRQPYYPQWIKDDKITFKGIRLADNGRDTNGTGTSFYLEFYGYGYVDNYPNSDNRAAIDIDWAIDKDGNPANLPGIDFVRVINGVNKENGWLGEASPEVGKSHDLHLLGIDIDSEL